MASLASINIVFKANLKEYSSEMQNARRELEKSGKQFQAIGAKMSLAMSVPLLALGGAAVKFGSDYQESLNKADVAFKDTSNEVRSFAKTTLDNFGIAEGSALDMAAQFGDMSTSMGLTTARASAMSTSLVGLAGDLASFKNIGIEQAQTALNGVFTGETESLKMLGIVMTEANLQQFAYSKGIKAKIKDMTQAEKVELRYAYVMAQTTNAQGDFARTGGGAANQMRIVQESLKQLAADIGQIILPAFTKVVVAVNGIIKGFMNLEPGTKKIIVVTAALAAVTGPLLSAYGYILALIPKIVTQFAVLKTSIVGMRVAQLAATVQTLALSAAQNLSMAGTQLFAAAQMVLTGNIVGATQAMNVFKASMLATPWGAIAIAIAAVGAAYYLYSTRTKELTAAQVAQLKMQQLENKINEQASQIIVDQRAKLEGLLLTAKNKFVSDKERQNAIKEINALSPKYLGNITLEGIETEKTTKAVNAYNDALLKGAMARAAQTALDDVLKNQIKEEFESLKVKKQLAEAEKEFQKLQKEGKFLAGANLQYVKAAGTYSKLNDAANKSKNEREINFLTGIIEANKKYLSVLQQVTGEQGKGSESGPKQGTIEYYEALISAQKKIQTTLSTSNDSFAVAQGKIEEYQKAIDKISGKRSEQIAIDTTGLSKSSQESVQFYEKQIEMLQKFQSQVATTSSQWEVFQREILENELKIALVVDQGSFDNANAAVRGFGDNFKKISKEFQTEQEKMKLTNEAIAASVESVIANFGTKITDALGLASTGFQGFTKVILETTVKLLSMMLAQSMANSIAGATAAGAATGPASVATTPAFIATAIAGVLSAFLAIPKFETGGIVGGSSLYGDKILARLNSREMILNQNQQKNLYGMINPAVTAQDMIVQLMGGFEIDGSKLRLVLNRTDAKNNRIR